MAIYKGNATREEMKTEALRRMEAFGLEKWVVQNLREQEQILVMEDDKENGCSFWKADEAWVKKIRRLEEEYGFFIYHILLNELPMFGEIKTMLFVANEADAWEDERAEMLRTGYTYAYVDSEMEDGVCGVVLRAENGVILRTN